MAAMPQLRSMMVVTDTLIRVMRIDLLHFISCVLSLEVMPTFLRFYLFYWILFVLQLGCDTHFLRFDLFYWISFVLELGSDTHFLEQHVPFLVENFIWNCKSLPLLHASGNGSRYILFYFLAFAFVCQVAKAQQQQRSSFNLMCAELGSDIHFLEQHVPCLSGGKSSAAAC